MSDNIRSVNLRHEEPCGCWRDVVRRKVPKFYTEAEPCGACAVCRSAATSTLICLDGRDPLCERIGQPVLGPDGGFTMVDNEDVEEGQCEEHAAEANARVLEAARLLEAGDRDGAERLLAGREIPALPSAAEEE